MNELDFLSAVGKIDDDLIREAEKKTKEKTLGKKPFVLFAAAAAAAVFALVFLILPRENQPAVLPPAGTTGETCGSYDVLSPEEAAELNLPTSEAAQVPTGETPTGAEEKTGGENHVSPSSGTQPLPAGETLPAPPPTEAPPVTVREPGEAKAVLSTISADFDTVKTLFAHPIVPCAADGFTGYQIGIVSRNGDPWEEGAFSVQVNYTFTRGLIAIVDQDRLRAGTGVAWSEPTAYRGYAFEVQRAGMGEGTVVGFFPTGETGICYYAVFDEGVDPEEVMDLIISILM